VYSAVILIADIEFIERKDSSLILICG